jgi:acetylornithine deacetylase/succinyl-diaminopimelate desuccinylase
MSSDLLRERVAARLADLDVVGLAAELVRIPSHPGLPRQEEAVATALAAWLGAHGVPSKLDPAAPGRPNLIARVSGGGAGRRLILCGHTDTVPLNGDGAGVGFSGAIRAGRLEGRGAVDMKGAIAAMAAALVALDGVLPAGAVELAAVVDEEMESIGAERYVRSGLAADGAIVGEPTRNRVAVAHKGLEWLDLRFEGRAAHGGTPEQGINAIVAAARFVARVESELQPRLAARAHPLLGPPTLNFGAIRGGDQPSTVAASCLLSADRRTVPGESYEKVIGELEELLRAVERELPGLRATVSRNAAGMATMEHLPLEIAADHPLVVAALTARRRQYGEVDGPVAFPAWTDGALLARPGGVPTLVLGPGELSLAHSPVEAVAVAELEAAAQLYGEIALDFCSGPVR